MNFKSLLLFVLLTICNAANARNKAVPVGIENLQAYSGYLKYRTEKSPKIFVTAPNGAWSWASRSSLQQAEEVALSSCQKHSNKCRVIDKNGKPLLGIYQPEGFLEKFQFQNRSFPSKLRTLRAAKKYTEEYLPLKGNKAFAVSEKGNYAWSSGALSVEEAKKLALRKCKRKNGDGTLALCQIVDINNRISADETTYESIPIAPMRMSNKLPAKWSKIITSVKLEEYFSAIGHKALAASIDGTVYYSNNFTSLNFAKEHALQHCNFRANNTSRCEIVLFNDNIAF